MHIEVKFLVPELIYWNFENPLSLVERLRYFDAYRSVSESSLQSFQSSLAMALAVLAEIFV